MDGYSCICSTCIRSSQTPLPSGLPYNIGQTSLRYIVGPYETTKNLPRIKKCPLSDILETTGFKLISKGFFQFKTTAMVTGYLDVCAKFLQSCPTHYNSTDCSQPGSCVHGFFQGKTQEWIAKPFSRGASVLRDQTLISNVSCIGRQVLYH